MKSTMRRLSSFSASTSTSSALELHKRPCRFERRRSAEIKETNRPSLRSVPSPATSIRRTVLAELAANIGLLHTLPFVWPQSSHAINGAVQEFMPAISPPDPLSPMEQTIIDVFEHNTYSVVNIFDVTIQGGQRMAQVDQPEGNGTGFIWDQQGHIVTNYHVLAGALQNLPAGSPDGTQKVARITLLGTDGASQTYLGYLIGADRSKDIAVVKINAPQDKLQPITLASSGSLKVGQQVLCIGNPFGFDHTLTTGVISGVGRDIQSRAGVVIGGGIQVDAAINPGNSGGPLLNSKGHVIGINTAIFTSSGTSAGVGFAIPADVVAQAVPQLIKYGKVIRPSLRIQFATDQIASALRVGRGALVQAVEPSSNAAKAGLLGTRRTLTGIASGDLIVALDGSQISGSGDLMAALDRYSVGEKVDLRIKREAGNGSEGKSVTLQLVLENEGGKR